MTDTTKPAIVMPVIAPGDNPPFDPEETLLELLAVGN
jgi:hypothetical protein